MVVTKADNEEVTLKKSIKEYFLKTRPILESGICPTAQLFSGSMDKWSRFCIMNLGYYKVLRFNELKSNIKGISARMLSVTLKRLEQNERYMLLWMRNVKKDECVSTSSLLKKLKLKSLESALRLNRLRWFGHVQRSDTWIRRVVDIEVE